MGKTKFKVNALSSDLPGLAKNQDPGLINSWDLIKECSSYWISNTGAANVKLLNKCGLTLKTVTVNFSEEIPLPDTPTGLTRNLSKGFIVDNGSSSASSEWIVVTRSGRIHGYSPLVDPDNAILTVNNSLDSSYTGVDQHDDLLYAANFGKGTIDVFNFNWDQLAPSFSDPSLPLGYSPFNVSIIDDIVYISYAFKSGDDPVAGAGLGLVNSFTLDGTFISRVIDAGGELNIPYSVVEGPKCIEKLDKKLIISNVGSGELTVYNLAGTLESKLTLCNGNSVSVVGIKGLVSGKDKIYFAAGIESEEHGLFGVIKQKKCHEC